MSINFLQLVNRKWSLRDVILIPFLFLIIVAMVLNGWLTFRMSEEAMTDFVSKLRTQISTHIQDRCKDNLKILPKITSINEKAIRSKALNLTSLSDNRWRQYLYEQIRLFNEVTTIGFGKQNGEAVWIQRDKPDSLFYAIASNDSVRQWLMDASGNLIGIKYRKTYNPTEREWYQKEEKWTEVYKWFHHGKFDKSGIAYSLPYYSTKESFEGVFFAEYDLKQLSEYLKSIDIDFERSGLFFVMTNELRLIRTSDDKVDADLDTSANIIKASECKNLLIKSVTNEWVKNYLHKAQQDSVTLFSLKHDGQERFVQIGTLHISPNINWLIVVVLHSQEFMKEYHANVRNTIFLSLVLLLFAILSTFFISNRITQPIRRINSTAEQIAKNIEVEKLSTQGPKEIGELSDSINIMSEDLKKEREKLKENKKKLEALAKFGAELSSKIDKGESDIFKFIYNTATEFMDTDNMFIALYDEAKDEVKFPFAYKVGNQIEVTNRVHGEGRTEAIIKSRKSMLICTRQESEAWYKQEGHKEYIEDPLASWIGAPMKLNEKILGVIATYHPTKDNLYTKEDLQILEAMADMVAVVLENTKILKRVAEVEREKMNAEHWAFIGRTAGSLAHRVGNKGGMIRLCVKDLNEYFEKKNFQDEWVKKQLNIIDRSNTHLLELSEYLFKPQLAKKEILEPANLINYLNDAQKYAEIPDDVIVDRNFSENLPQVLGNKYMVDVFLELIVNAVEAMSLSKEKKLTISALEKDKHLEIKFTDTGRGITPDDEEYIFDLFSHLSDKKPHKGSHKGFGLWGAKTFLNDIGGSIRHEKGQKQGANFIIELPIAEVTDGNRK